MKKRILAALLAGAMVLSLAACGGKNDGGSSASGAGGSSSQTDASTGGSSLGGSSPDASQPDASQPGEVALTLNKTEITLNKAGGTFQLKYTAEPAVNASAVFTSSDEKVATVDGSGTITAVAPGKATVTVELAGAAAACAVTCDWKDEPSNTTKPADDKPAGDTSKPADNTPAPAANVDLQAFFDTTTGKYEFGMLALADNDILDALYAGLTGIGMEQTQVYYCPMSMNNGEFCMVQVKDSKDVDAVKAIFQARVDYMVGDGNGPGGAQYPMAMDQWENFSRIVSNGNYVMMIVHENCDDIVSEFNALF